jgi:hypothetical protein
VSNNGNETDVVVTYLLQSVTPPRRGRSRATLQRAGSVLARAGMTPNDGADCIMHLHMARRASAVVASRTSDCAPWQQPAGGA